MMMIRKVWVLSSLLAWMTTLFHASSTINAFQPVALLPSSSFSTTTRRKRRNHLIHQRYLSQASSSSSSSFEQKQHQQQDDTQKIKPVKDVVKKEEEEPEILGPLAAAAAAAKDSDSNDNDSSEAMTVRASTGTVNERLMAELQEATGAAKPKGRSKLAQKLRLDTFASQKTDAERKASIEEARNLNGVNPVVALTASIFALAAAAGLWYLTSYLAGFFATHPLIFTTAAETDFYVVQRLSAVFRNVVMGLMSLASGFFGVTGLGLFLLGVRVAYGVIKGELDPTPIQKKTTTDSTSLDLTNVWDLMLNPQKATGRRGRK